MLGTVPGAVEVPWWHSMPLLVLWKCHDGICVPIPFQVLRKCYDDICVGHWANAIAGAVEVPWWLLCTHSISSAVEVLWWHLCWALGQCHCWCCGSAMMAFVLGTRLMPFLVAKHVESQVSKMLPWTLWAVAIDQWWPAGTDWIRMLPKHWRNQAPLVFYSRLPTCLASQCSNLAQLLLHF